MGFFSFIFLTFAQDNYKTNSMKHISKEEGKVVKSLLEKFEIPISSGEYIESLWITSYRSFIVNVPKIAAWANEHGDKQVIQALENICEHIMLITECAPIYERMTHLFEEIENLDTNEDTQ